MKAIVREGQAQLVDPAGGRVEVPLDQAASFISRGYRPQTAEEYSEAYTRQERSGLGQKAVTLGEGALEGATFGLGTAAAAEIGGPEYRKAALERRAVNPGTHLVGQVAGAVLPALASGGESLGAKAVAGIGAPARLAAGGAEALGGAAAGLVRGESVLANAARAGVRYGVSGAAEGAAYGLGTSIADSALEDTDWTARKALAGMRDGALFGLGAGAATGVVGSLGASAGRKVLDAMLGGKTLKQAARDFADGRTLKTIADRDAKAWGRITRNGEQPERAAELAADIRRRGIDQMSDAEKRAALKAAKQEYARTLDEVTRRLDEPIEQTRKTVREQLVLEPTRIEQPERAALERLRNSNGKRVLLSDLRKDLAHLPREEQDALLLQLQDQGALVLYQDDAYKMPTRSRAAAEERAYINAGELKVGGGAPRHLAYAIPENVEKALAELPAPVQFQHVTRPVETVETFSAPAVTPDLRAMRQEIQDKIIDPLNASGSGTAARIARNIEREVKPFFAKLESGKPVTFQDLRTFKSKIGAAKNWDVTNRALGAEQSRLYGIVARHLDDAAEAAGPELGRAWREANRGYDDFSTLADAFSKKVKREASNRYLGVSDYFAGRETGWLVGILSGNPAAGIVSGLATSVVHRMLRDRGSAAVGRLANWVANYEGRVSLAARAAARLVPVSELPAKVATRANTASERAKAFEDVQRTVTKASSDPEFLAQQIRKITDPIAAEQPEVAVKMARQYQGDLAWLHDRMPTPFRPWPTLSPGATKGVVPVSEQKKIVAYAEALEDPARVLEDLARGDIDWYGLEALKERRPDDFADMRESVMVAVARAGKELDYRTSSLYSVAFDFSGNPFAARVPRFQAAFAPKEPPPAPSPGPGRPPEAAGGDLATPYQKALVPGS